MISSLVVTICGRAALPVRAIPYIAMWEVLDPLELAMLLGDKMAPPFDQKLKVQAFHLVDGQPTKILPGEWGAVVAKIEGLQAELEQQFSTEAKGYATWRERSAALLPAAAFVWLDEFQQGFKPPSRDHELALAPMLDEHVIIMVFEGMQPALRASADKARQDEFDAMRKAGRYTMEGAAYLFAKGTGESADRMQADLMQAGRGGDADLSWHAPGSLLPTKSDTARWFWEEVSRDDLNRWIGKKYPRIRWQYPKPEDTPTAAEQEPAAMVVSEVVSASTDWRTTARAIADELDLADKKAGAHDSVANIAERVAMRMRERVIHGPRGPLSGSTILREALQGKRWARKK